MAIAFCTRSHSLGCFAFASLISCRARSLEMPPSVSPMYCSEAPAIRSAQAWEHLSSNGPTTSVSGGAFFWTPGPATKVFRLDCNSRIFLLSALLPSFLGAGAGIAFGFVCAIVEISLDLRRCFSQLRFSRPVSRWDMNPSDRDIPGDASGESADGTIR